MELDQKEEILIKMALPFPPSEGQRQDDAERTILFSKLNLIFMVFLYRISNVCFGAEKFSLKDTNSNEYLGKKSQYMIGFFFTEGYEIIRFYVPKPIYHKNKNLANVHTEEMIIQLIDDYLSKTFFNKKPKGIIVLYSLNSPCIERKNDEKVSCMCQLSNKAKEWHNTYGIVTEILFTKYWGPFAPNCSVIQSIPERFAKHRDFIIRHEQQKKLLKNDLISMVSDKTNENNVKKEYDNIIKALESYVTKNKKKSLPFQTHLDEVNKVIKSCTDNPTLIDKFMEIWQKKLKRQEKESIDVTWTELLNPVIVKSFIQHKELNLGESSPIKFDQIPMLMDLSVFEERIDRYRRQTSFAVFFKFEFLNL